MIVRTLARPNGGRQMPLGSVKSCPLPSRVARRGRCALFSRSLPHFGAAGSSPAVRWVEVLSELLGRPCPNAIGMVQVVDWSPPLAQGQAESLPCRTDLESAQ